MASTAEKLDPELWEQAKADARDAFGGHSARAMQLAVKLYKQRGGRYRGPKKKDNRLTQWSRQDWKTKSGRPSRETGERYLPAAAIESLTPAEYGATTRAKRRGGGVGSVVAQPQSIRKKTRKFRKVNPDMATAKQIAARKKFAERARSGELARMRKKNPVKKPTRATIRKANPDGNDLSTFLVKMSDRKQVKTIKAADFEQAMERAVGKRLYSASSRPEFQRSGDVITEKFYDVNVSDSGSKTLLKKIKVHVALFADLKYKPRSSNPTATRAASRKANPISDVAQTIYQQLGANRFVAMTGAKNFVGGEDYLMFSIPRNMSPYNKVKITYIPGRDLYDVDFMKVTRAGGVAKGEPYNDVYAEQLRELFTSVTGMETSLGTMGRRANPTATRPGRSRTKLVSNGGRKSNPATKDVFFVNVIDDGGFQFGMDDRTPVLFKFSNREMKKGVYRSFALPFNVTSNAEFQNFVKSLPGNQIVISLKDLRKQLSAYA